jgi:adenylyl cyclase-associated protein
MVMQEYQENEPALEVANVDITQVINLFACKNTTVIIKGKVNAVTLGQCLLVWSNSILTHKSDS